MAKSNAVEVSTRAVRINPATCSVSVIRRMKSLKPVIVSVKNQIHIPFSGFSVYVQPAPFNTYGSAWHILQKIYRVSKS